MARVAPPPLGCHRYSLDAGRVSGWYHDNRRLRRGESVGRTRAEVCHDHAATEHTPTLTASPALALSQYFGRLTERLGFGAVRLHDLRHAFATNLIGRVGIKDTSSSLGHASEMFTSRVYQHRPQEASARAAAQAIAEVYGD
jgi:integrase